MKHVLLFTLLLGAVALQAQDSENDKRTIPKGTWNVGVDFRVGFFNADLDYETNATDTDRFSISIYPKVGYTFADNWMIGMKTGYGFSKLENDWYDSEDNLLLGEDRSENITIAPYIRKYYGLSKNLLIHLQGELGYSASWTERFEDNEKLGTSTSDEFYAALRPGISFFVSKKLALESSFGALQYSSFKRVSSGGSENKTQVFDFSLDSSNLLFGLSYYF